MYPTPTISGEISHDTDPPLSGAPKTFSGASFQSFSAEFPNLYSRPRANPPKMVLAWSPAPATSRA